MHSFSIKSSCSLLTRTLAKPFFLGVASLGLSLAAMPSFAADFTYQDSPSISLDFSAVSVDPVDNVRNVNSLQAINIGDSRIEAGYVVPFLWSTLDGGATIFGLNWQNDLDGWFTEDYDGSGNSLLIQSSLPDRLRLGDIADITGVAALPLTQPCSDSPSCIPFPPSFPAITQQADDEIPFLDFGTLAVGDSQFFDESFTFTFEDDREGTLLVGTAAYTVERVSQDVPEPVSVMAILIVGGTMTFLKRRCVAS